MLIKRRTSHHPTEQDVTPETVYQDRRRILKGLGLGVGAATLAFPVKASLLDLFAPDKPAPVAPTRPLDIRAATRPEGLILTPEEKATTHNNFYELGTDKGDPARNGHYLRPEPWTLKVEGRWPNPSPWMCGISSTRARWRSASIGCAA
jgi:sulfoxide reductase catalytic subunit YedY